MSNNKKEEILTDIKEVTNGLIKDFGLNNSYSSWKNTEIGLRLIKEDTTKFNLGVKLWLKIVENEILSQEIWEVIDILDGQFIWLNNLKNIKEYLYI